MVSAPHSSSHTRLQSTTQPSWLQQELGWLCCVRCRTTPGSRESEKCTFFITDCGHIYCSNCKAACLQKCVQCSKTEMKYLAITSSVRDHSQVGFLFCDLPEACKKLNRLIEFQNMHKKRSSDHDRAQQCPNSGALYKELSTVNLSELQNRLTAETKNNKTKELAFKQMREQSQQAMKEIEDIVVQLRSLGWQDTDIFSMQTEGGSIVNGTHILQETIGLLNHTKQMSSIHSLAQKMKGVRNGNETRDQSRLLTTPQRTPVRGESGVSQEIGLNPFAGSGNPPSTQRAYKTLPPPPPPPPLPHTLTHSHPHMATPSLSSQTNSMGSSPMSWQHQQAASPIGNQMHPPRMPPSRRAPNKKGSVTPSPQSSRMPPGQRLTCRTPSPSPPVPMQQLSQVQAMQTSPGPFITPTHLVGHVVRRGSDGGMDVIPGQSRRVTPDQNAPRTTPSSGSTSTRVSVRARPSAGKIGEGGCGQYMRSPSPIMPSQRTTPNSSRVSISQHYRRRT